MGFLELEDSGTFLDKLSHLKVWMPNFLTFDYIFMCKFGDQELVCIL